MNQIFLGGNLAEAPKLRRTTNGVEYVSFRLVVPNTYTGRNQPDYFYCVCFGDKGKSIASNCFKGARIFLQGRMQQSIYDDGLGNKASFWKVICYEVFYPIRDERELMKSLPDYMRDFDFSSLPD